MAKRTIFHYEVFVQEYLKNGFNGTSAYMVAFPKSTRITAHGQASRILARPEVKRRLAVLQRNSALRTEVTVERLIREADDIQQKALVTNHLAVAVSALTAKAKLAGVWIDRTQSVNANVSYAVSDQPPSEAEWEAMHVTKD
jgi:hypothetical protein